MNYQKKEKWHEFLARHGGTPLRQQTPKIKLLTWVQNGPCIGVPPMKRPGMPRGDLYVHHFPINVGVFQPDSNKNGGSAFLKLFETNDLFAGIHRGLLPPWLGGAERRGGSHACGAGGQGGGGEVGGPYMRGGRWRRREGPTFIKIFRKNNEQIDKMKSGRHGGDPPYDSTPHVNMP